MTHAHDSSVAHSAAHPAASDRLCSLDVFRGITIAGMLLVNHPGTNLPYPSLKHAAWHGWTPTDLVFPFFLFIVGVAIPFSLARRALDPDQTRGRLLGQIWLRALSLFMLGLLLGALSGALPSLPDGYLTLKAFRVLIMIFVYAGILALLIPWKWRRVSIWLPPAIAAAFFLLLITSHFVVKHATDAGLSPQVVGGGMFRPERFRFPGVLQRIGICYGVAATVALFAGWRTILLSAILLLAGYSALMLATPFPDHDTGSLTKLDNLERKIDEAVFDRYTTDADGKRHYSQKHTYGEYPDPEGILSTLPAIATVLLGFLLGLWLRSNRTNVDKCAAVLAGGVFVTILGTLLHSWLMPINKQIWTPSFVIFTAGMAMLGLGAIFWVVDVLGRGRWALPFTILGMNAIAAYVAGAVVPHVARMIHVRDAASGTSVPLNEFINHRAMAAVQRSAAWLPGLDAAENLALVFPIMLIVFVILLMSILYVSRIFVRV